MAAVVTSEAQVCNLALGFVGQRQFIQNLTEATTEAQICKAYYSVARDSVLAKHAWSFAQRHSTLALTTSVRDGWGYCYSPPADMLEDRWLFSGSRIPTLDTEIPYALELGDDGQSMLLLTDLAAASLVYTCQQTAVGLFSAPFILAIAWELAGWLALSLTVKPQVGLEIGRQALLALNTAIAADNRRGRGDPAPDSEIIRGR